MAFVKSQLVSTTGEERRGQGRDCSSLERQLESADATQRRWAARDLGECPAASAALVSRLQRETEASVREVILTSLTSLGGEVAVAGLVDCLRSEDVALRNQAIEAMKQLPNAVAKIMHGLLTDPNPDVRIFAVNVLESLRHPDVESWLIAVIASDPHVNVCAAAVDLLGEVGSPAAREPLLQLKARFAGEPYILFAADLALKRLGDA